MVEGSRVVMRFAHVEVQPHRRVLLAGGMPVRIGDRAFDILLALLERRGELVTKEELLERVWTGLVVEEINLSVQVSALRKALGPARDLLQTVSGRGYRLVADVTVESLVAATVDGRVQPPSPPVDAVLTNLPALTSELIGREAEVKEVLALVADRRLVTLAGTGGIGKTRLALEIARRLLPRFADGAWLVEFGPISDPGFVPVTVASALEISLAAGALSAERVAAALGTKQVLLVLDNCEHVIDAAAGMAEALLRANPAACLIATSREPLRAEGECVYQVPPLGLPDADTGTSEELLQHGAVQLFVARARAAQPHFALDRLNTEAVTAICRRLDGIPLAIELAAARAAALGVEGLAARLDDRFRLLTDGRRTALPRQQTLRATLDWSYELLPATERTLLRRLALFAGPFPLASANDVVAIDPLSSADVLDCIVNLVAKSLLTADVSNTVAQYRLLETTRAYALEKLVEGGEFEAMARRHAEYYLRVFEGAAAEWDTLPTTQWLAQYDRHLDNVRAALDWALSPAGDVTIGVALAVAAIPLWMHLSMMEECRMRAERALAGLPRGSAPRSAMHLEAALGLALMYTKGAVPETRAALLDALAIAEHLEDADFQLRALWGLCVDRLNNGVFRAALTYAERFRHVAETMGDPADRPIGDRMMALSLHYLGDEAQAHECFERMLTRYVAPARRSHMIRFQFDQRVTAHVAFAEVLWIRGFPDRAMHAVEDNIREAQALDHALSLCNALAKACPVALLAGDLEAAEWLVDLLLEQAARNALSSWQAEGRCFRGLLSIRRGEAADGIQTLAGALAELPGINFSLRYTGLLGELADAYGSAGRIAQGLDAIEEALGRSERNEERWCAPELLRIKGELVLKANGPDSHATADRLFGESLDGARRQSALSWELRTATSLARLRVAQGDVDAARTVLGPVYERFTEGFGTPDLVAARTLLTSLR